MCVVRRDLPLGVIAAQVIHAAGESSVGVVPGRTRAVALMVEDEPALARVAQALADAQVEHVAIREPDPPWSGALMAIGVSPIVDPRRCRKVLARLPLLR